MAEWGSQVQLHTTNIHALNLQEIRTIAPTRARATDLIRVVQNLPTLRQYNAESWHLREGSAETQ